MLELSTTNLLSLAVPGLAINSLAWVHAWAVTHYGSRDRDWLPPDKLPVGDKVRLALTGKPCPRPENRCTPADVGLPFQVERLPAGRQGWLEVWQIPPRDRASGVALLFPAYSESKDTLLATASILHALGYRLLLVDFRGAGGSSGNSTTLGVREAKDVEIAVRFACRHWPELPLVLFGMSMGAVAITRAIAHHGVCPDALLLECPFDRLLSAVRHRLQVMGVPASGLAELILFWGCLQHGHNGFTHSPVDYVRAIACPTLVMRGSSDPRVSAPEIECVFRAIHSPKQFLEFSGAGHELLADYDAKLWRTRVAAFLSEAIVPQTVSC
ncbi:MAG: alpha/beta hydrolase [Cyanobacteria bacterium J06641_5]